MKQPQAISSYARCSLGLDTRFSLVSTAITRGPAFLIEAATAGALGEDGSGNVVGWPTPLPLGDIAEQGKVRHQNLSNGISQNFSTILIRFESIILNVGFQ